MRVIIMTTCLACRLLMLDHYWQHIHLGPKIVYGHMEKYATFGMIACDNKMQSCSHALSVLFWQ